MEKRHTQPPRDSNEPQRPSQGESARKREKRPQPPPQREVTYLEERRPEHYAG